MLDKLIIIDYADGAGGEYFSNFISSHAGFFSEMPLHENMQNSTDRLQKFFNSRSLIVSNFETDLIEFEQICEHNQIKNISIPYHLYKFPDRIEQFNKIAKSVRFVRITVSDNYHSYDFLRKVLLNTLTHDNMAELSFRTADMDRSQKIQLIQRLKNKNLYWLDFSLIKQNEKINTSTRQQYLNLLLSREYNLPSADIEIYYDDFFVNFNNTVDKYNLLCHQLDIIPNHSLIEQLISRNTKNLKELLIYKEKFKEIFESL
jgi:hypothetical protein